MIPINPKRNVLDRRLPKAFSIDKHSRLPRGTNHEMKRFLFSADVRMSTLIDPKPPYKKFANKTCKEGRANMSSSIQRRVHWDHGAHGGALRRPPGGCLLFILSHLPKKQLKYTTQKYWTSFDSLQPTLPSPALSYVDPSYHMQHTIYNTLITLSLLVSSPCSSRCLGQNHPPG